MGTTRPKNQARERCVHVKYMPGFFFGNLPPGDIGVGKRTLIVIELLERLPAADGERLRAILLKPPEATEESEVDWAIGLAESTGALEAVQGHCRSLGKEAQAKLEPLPPSPQRALLEAMAQYLVEDRES